MKSKEQPVAFFRVSTFLQASAFHVYPLKHICSINLLSNKKTQKFHTDLLYIWFIFGFFLVQIISTSFFEKVIRKDTNQFNLVKIIYHILQWMTIVQWKLKNSCSSERTVFLPEEGGNVHTEYNCHITFCKVITPKQIEKLLVWRKETGSFHQRINWEN